MSIASSYLRFGLYRSQSGTERDLNTRRYSLCTVLLWHRPHNAHETEQEAQDSVVYVPSLPVYSSSVTSSSFS